MDIEKFEQIERDNAAFLADIERECKDGNFLIVLEL